MTLYHTGLGVRVLDDKPQNVATTFILVLSALCSFVYPDLPIFIPSDVDIAEEVLEC